MKVLAMYLPQYHEVKENNEWWGQGYTEWTAVKSAVSYSKIHSQPRVPLDNNYYDLSDPMAKTWKWQAELAKKYGIDGFVIYHYWFATGSQLLQKPMEILLEHKEIDINYCICWANESWTRTWYGLQKEVLMAQQYGDESEWRTHFYYLLQFFQDERYIKIDNKPVINIYHSKEIECLKEMLNVWNEIAIQHGFSGIYVVSGNTGAALDDRIELFNAYYNFEPSYTLMHKQTRVERYLYLIKVLSRSIINRKSRRKVIERVFDGKKFINRMMRKDPITQKEIFPGAFPRWDNTPRRQYKGTVFYNMSPSVFAKQLHMMMEKYKNSKFLYVNAWNEWGEGAYLEPDTQDGYSFLEVISDEKIQDH